MVVSLIKLATKVILTNPNLRKKAGKLAFETYKKAEPIIKKQAKTIKKTINEVSPLEEPIKFKNKLKKNLKL